MIIIPDIHGRSFWKDAVKNHENEEIIFLGDYTDPYAGFEPVEVEDGLKSLKEVTEFKKQHMDTVTLLIGNHDLSYVTEHVFKCRHDDRNHEEISNIILSNKKLFAIAHDKWIAGKRYLFTHAGVLKGWLSANESSIGSICIGDEADRLNEMFQDCSLYPALGDVSAYRGGWCETGSCVLADVREHIENYADSLLGCYQVFGHTNLQTQPFITDKFACLDCQRAFILDDEGNFSVVEPDQNV